jgi:putative Mg2+ transporter-C (MgtC) family protein
MSLLVDQLVSLPVVPHVAVLLLAYLLALPIGWNREKEERSAGLRTFPLVAVATCGVVQATETILKGDPEGTSNVISGLISGMGFIGGGAILKTADSVRGTATAASLWATGATGATGAAVGLRSYDVGAAISAFTFLTLYALSPLKKQQSDPAQEPARGKPVPDDERSDKTLGSDDGEDDGKPLGRSAAAGRDRNR